MVNWSDDYPVTDDGSAAHEPVAYCICGAPAPCAVHTFPVVRSSDVTAAAEQIGRLICERDQLQREVKMVRELLSRLPDETESDKAAVVSPVQQHVDAIVQDLVSGSVTTVQRGTLRDALNNAAIGSITRRG